MREIKFRGKCIKGRKTGQFVYGDLLHFDGGETSIRTYDADGVYTLLYAVDPATVGQFTGLLDKTGKEIYEGDVLQTEKFGKDDGQGHNFSGKENFSVVFEHGAYRIKRRGRKLLLVDGSYYEAVGNVHDAPELLK